jgi:leader peptidase (prepilin peptidase)/N-methyltransferase
MRRTGVSLDGMGAGVASGCVLLWLAALSIYDIRERRLPNWLTLPGAAVILAMAAVHGRGVPAMLGAVTLFGVYAVVHLVSPTSMGAGDVKLAIGIGALTATFGSDIWLLAALGAPLLTAGLAVAALLRQSEQTVPHGPSMCLAAVMATALAVV